MDREQLDAGLQHGDRLGVWAPNSADWTLTQFATARIGVVLVTITRPTGPPVGPC